MDSATLIIAILCGVNLTFNIVNMTFILTLRRHRDTPPPAPSTPDHFQQLEKRLYDLTNQRFGGTIK